jgi:glycosyltransferase involved in cell wall biosynthesis
LSGAASSGPRELRMAFTLRPRARWAGGYYYLLNLARVLRQHPAAGIRPIVFPTGDVPAADLEPFRAVIGSDLIADSEIGRAGRPRRLAAALATGRDDVAARAYRSAEIDVVFAAGDYFGWRFPMPAVVWIPDFQHRWLPQMFDRATIHKRNVAHAIQLASAGSVMLSSEAARRDCITFFPRSTHKAIAVPFAVPAPAVGSLDSAAVRETYQLPERFFYLPNTFWKHKNHRLVCEALHLLMRDDGALVVAASGDPVDPRHPNHFREIEEFVRSNSLSGVFRILGPVPYSDVTALMRLGVAVVNPSLFEGWSTTVEEAKSLGAPLLLSDIPVHREQARPDTRFFSPTSPEDLARVLAESYRELPPGPRPEAERAAAAQASRDAARFAMRFAEAARLAFQGDASAIR